MMSDVFLLPLLSLRVDLVQNPLVPAAQLLGCRLLSSRVTQLLNRGLKVEDQVLHLLNGPPLGHSQFNFFFHTQLNLAQDILCGQTVQDVTNLFPLVVYCLSQ